VDGQTEKRGAHGGETKPLERFHAAPASTFETGYGLRLDEVERRLMGDSDG
jgi:hypothetical protein